MYRAVLVFVLLIVSPFYISAEERKRPYGVGYGLTGPYGASGLALSARINKKYGVKLVTNLSDGAALQADIFAFENSNFYWVVGVGSDTAASSIKAGFGMQWFYNDFIVYWEPAFALPHFKDKDNLWAVEALYYFAPGLGVRYTF